MVESRDGPVGRGWSPLLSGRVRARRCAAGPPAVDGLRPRSFLPNSLWPHAADAWDAAWRACLPGSDPARAITLAAPLADLAYTVRYQEFLDGIEHSERIYHLGDPAAMIRRALHSAAAADLGLR
jgi:hypothetical protein